MYPKISVNLGNLVLSLSDALDLAFSSLAMHQQRTAFIAWELGKRAKLEGNRIENVFLASLLHDIGALSIEEKKSLHDNETSEVEQHCIRGKNLPIPGLLPAQTWCDTTTGVGSCGKSHETLPKCSTRNYSFSQTTWNVR